jgi:hypothetical protein
MIKSKRVGLVGCAARIWRNLIQIRRWVDNIKVGLREIGLGEMDWINLAQGRDWWRDLVETVMNLLVP